MLILLFFLFFERGGGIFSGRRVVVLGFVCLLSVTFNVAGGGGLIQWQK